MKHFKIFVHSFLKYYLAAILAFGVVYWFTLSPIFLGLIIGTIASTLCSFVWCMKLLRSIESDDINIGTGMIHRVLIVCVACSFWIKFPEQVDVLGVLVGIVLHYIAILIFSTIRLIK
ncbi:ATP synthase subunit I [Abyssicoccus albus]|uniref:ATP synthase protein I n=1 Tax=Abyssicoccus albus TaxID=1817405 RepID=A0A1Q1G027_9BACL|nr:ATP synthase subunit I [Abyssicoccus albus]AQL55701.1 hypothetical protein BVH56_01400 [Abyssicoccus albus]RPF56443.1 ATP synthase protein I [Abyssicoccus albus]